MGKATVEFGGAYTRQVDETHQFWGMVDDNYHAENYVMEGYILQHIPHPGVDPEHPVPCDSPDAVTLLRRSEYEQCYFPPQAFVPVEGCLNLPPGTVKLTDLPSRYNSRYKIHVNLIHEKGTQGEAG